MEKIEKLEVLILQTLKKQGTNEGVWD